MQHKTIKINRDKVQGIESFWSTKMTDVIFEWLKAKNMRASTSQPLKVQLNPYAKGLFGTFFIFLETEKEKEKFI